MVLISKCWRHQLSGLLRTHSYMLTLPATKTMFSVECVKVGGFQELKANFNMDLWPLNSLKAQFSALYISSWFAKLDIQKTKTYLGGGRHKLKSIPVNLRTAQTWWPSRSQILLSVMDFWSCKLIVSCIIYYQPKFSCLLQVYSSLWQESVWSNIYKLSNRDMWNS